ADSAAPMGTCRATGVEVQVSLALFERVFQYLDLPHDIVDAEGARTLPPDEGRGRVALRNVWLRDEAPDVTIFDVTADGDGSNGGAPTREWTLEDVSLEVEPGQLAAIGGPRGGGETNDCELTHRA